MTDLPTVAEYAALDQQHPTEEAALHQRIVAHVLERLAAADDRRTSRLTVTRLSDAAEVLENALLQRFTAHPEVLARTLVTHLIDDYMSTVERRR